MQGQKGCLETAGGYIQDVEATVCGSGDEELFRGGAGVGC